PELKEQFLPIVRHGLAYLRDVMWDKRNGGFYWILDEEGRPLSGVGDGKHLYGMSFWLYGVGGAYEATGDKRALELAQAAFKWMDAAAHDAVHGGYNEWLTASGSIVSAVSGKPQEVPVAGFPIGFKSMNTHIHLLESFTQLYEVWKDPGVK